MLSKGVEEIAGGLDHELRHRQAVETAVGIDRPGQILSLGRAQASQDAVVHIVPHGPREAPVDLVVMLGLTIEPDEGEEGQNRAFVEAFKEAVAGQTGVGSAFEGAEINTIDGLRANFEDGWGLVRPSNTTPVLVVRFDAETEEALDRIKSTFRRQMLDLDPDLDLPF